MKKMLYCMHVGWNWIKQRPHFIAEEMAESYDLTVVSNFTYRQKKSQSIAQPHNFVLKQFYKIPLIDHFPYVAWINTLIRKVFYSTLIKKIKPDYIYVMTPTAIAYLPDNAACKIVYDCMDDMLGFSANQNEKERIFEKEKKLIEISDFVIVSSENLKNCLLQRYPILKEKKYIVVRNAFNGDILKLKENKKNNIYTICYFGTIAEWFNFGYLLNCLEEFEDIQFWLFGPLQDKCTIPVHERIIYKGTVKHEDLFDSVSECDAFMMPFIVNDLIKSVDPVKFYEYINFGKNIISVYYEEIDRFSDFCFFYNNYEEFLEQIRLMKNNKKTKYTMEQRIKFLMENTWEQRGKQIRNLLEDGTINEEK